MKLLALLSFFLLLVLPAWAQQTVITGRTTDRATGLPLPGCTILQSGTTNGVSSDSDGSFSLPVPDSLAFVSLSISAIGYATQQQLVNTGSGVDFALSAEDKELCDLHLTPRWQVGVAAGVRYAPVGATVRLSRAFFQVPLSMTASYQTNLRRNHAFTARLGLPQLVNRNRLHVTEALHYQDLRAAPANLRFRSGLAIIAVGTYWLGGVRVPDLLLGAGYGSCQPWPNGEISARRGYGYTGGLRHTFPYPLAATLTAQATRWPDFWQWESSLTRAIYGQFSAGVAFTQLRRYREASLTLTRSFL